MPNYRYRARDKSGKVVTGIIGAADKTAAARSLDGMGYIPITIDEAKTAEERKLIGRRKKIKLLDLNIFTRQLVTLQKAGLPLLSSLHTIEKQITNPTLKDIIKEVSASVEGGSSLSVALEKHPKIFSELYVSMVRAGEAGGILDEVLDRLATLGENELDTRRKIQAALRYPMMASIVLVSAVFILVTFVVPKFATVFSQFKAGLPLPTKILLLVGNWMKRFWYIVVLGMAGLVYIFRRAVGTPRGKAIWDQIVLKTPVFGNLIKILAISRFTRITALLVRSGLPILQVLSMSARAADNYVITHVIDDIAASVREGKGLTEPMTASGMFPPLVLQMVAVGEETGKIDELLLKVSDFYEEQADYTIQNLTSLIEPIFVSVMGAVMLVIALAIFLPMWNLMTLFKR